jgi:hypothetical protein
MASRIISNESDTRGNYTQRTVLDGREYVLRFRWNQRAAKWYLSLFDQDESPIYVGVKLVINFPLFGPRLVDDRAPPGELLAIDTEATGADPGLHDLGGRIKIVYIDGA